MMDDTRVSWNRLAMRLACWLFMLICALELMTTAVHAAGPDCRFAEEGEWHRDSKLCYKFYRCISRKAFPSFCPLPLVFSLKLKVCVWEFDQKNNDCDQPEQHQDALKMKTTTPASTTTTAATTIAATTTTTTAAATTTAAEAATTTTTTTALPPPTTTEEAITTTAAATKTTTPTAATTKAATTTIVAETTTTTMKPITTKKPPKKFKSRKTKSTSTTTVPQTQTTTSTSTTTSPQTQTTTSTSTTTAPQTQITTTSAEDTMTFETDQFIEIPDPGLPIRPIVPNPPDLPIIEIPSGHVNDPLPARTDCSGGFTGTYPHPRGCALFYDCNLNYAILPRHFKQHMDECPYPQLYSTVTQRCEDYKDVECGDRNVPISPCEYRKLQCGSPHCQPCSSRWASCTNRKDGIHSHQYKLWSPYYSICKDQRVVGEMKQCPSTYQIRQIFHPMRKECVDIVEVPTEKYGLMPDCTGQDDGRYPDILERESFYYTCKDEQFEELVRCPTSYIYDRDVEECKGRHDDRYP